MNVLFVTGGQKLGGVEVDVPSIGDQVQLHNIVYSVSNVRYMLDTQPIYAVAVLTQVPAPQNLNL